MAFAMNCHYQKATNKSLLTSASELKVFFGISIVMSNLKFPRLRMFWSKKFRVPIICEKMPRDWFFKLRQNVKFLLYDEVDEDTKRNDRLWKVRPLLSFVRYECLKLEREQFVCIDEQMIPFAGRCSLKQYVPNKPNPLGLKKFVLAGSSGLVYDFVIYQGKTTFVPELQAKGLSSAAVLHLCQDLSEGSYLFFDRYFTSISLLEKLSEKRINATGTLMKNRLEGLPAKTDRELKRTGRGTSFTFTREDRVVAVTQWYDNKPIFLASSCYGKEPELPVSRYNKSERKYIDIPSPLVVRQYNKNMGGVDLCDRMVSYYRFSSRTKKWPV